MLCVTSINLFKSYYILTCLILSTGVLNREALPTYDDTCGLSSDSSSPFFYRALLPSGLTFSERNNPSLFT
uniref:Uncharacterized protein n=1 Tax=Arundo donax TaxID=35708 RepID=A0A0A9AQE6_ARUDO